MAVAESVLLKLKAFTRNGSDEVCDGACFYCHAIVASFQ